MAQWTLQFQGRAQLLDGAAEPTAPQYNRCKDDRDPTDSTVDGCALPIYSTTISILQWSLGPPILWIVESTHRHGISRRPDQCHHPLNVLQSAEPLTDSPVQPNPNEQPVFRLWLQSVSSRHSSLQDVFSLIPVLAKGETDMWLW